MVKCPFCGFDNEDGALFCEQCKSDLSSATPTPPPVPAGEPIPMAGVMEETVPLATPLEGMPMAAPIAGDATVPVADVVQATPVEPPPAAAVEAAAVAAAAAPAAAPAAPAAAPAEAAAQPSGPSVQAGAQPKLVVIRGQKRDAEFPIYPDLNFIGRADEKPVDIDLEDQEPPDRVYCSRQHAVINFEEAAGIITIEDLNSSNGTYVN